jgi:hypothetical protein
VAGGRLGPFHWTAAAEGKAVVRQLDATRRKVGSGETRGRGVGSREPLEEEKKREKEYFERIVIIFFGACGEKGKGAKR